MVKLSLKGAQDPTDSSLQMKVSINLLVDKAVSRTRTQAPNWAGTQPQSLRHPSIRKKQSDCQIQILVPSAQPAQDQERSRSNLAGQWDLREKTQPC